MITCKGDLIGTYIKNDNGELRDLYISLCESLFVDGTPKDLMMSNEEWLGLNRECKFIGVYEGGMWIAHQYRSKEKEITISDLKPIPQTKEVEWVCVEGLKYAQVDFNSTISSTGGETCIDSDLYFAWSNKNIVHISDVSAKDLLMNRHKLCKKVETPEQKLERERIENGKAFYELMSEIEVSVMNPEDHGTPNPWDELRDEWQQVYTLQAERLNYKVKGE